MNRHEDARAFAGADWEKLTERSRRTLLKGNGQREVFAGHRWRQLPPSVQEALIAPLMREPQRKVAA